MGRIAGQGSKWITKKKRKQLYERDGYACGYCKRNSELHDIQLSLDHLVPCSKGGTNEASNLITACISCNSARGNRSVQSFCNIAVQFFNLNTTGRALAQQIRRQAKRPYDTAKAEQKLQLVKTA